MTRKPNDPHGISLTNMESFERIAIALERITNTFEEQALYKKRSAVPVADSVDNDIKGSETWLVKGELVDCQYPRPGYITNKYYTGHIAGWVDYYTNHLVEKPNNRFDGLAEDQRHEVVLQDLEQLDIMANKQPKPRGRPKK